MSLLQFPTTCSSFEFQISPERPFVNYIYLFAVLHRSYARGIFDLGWILQDPVPCPATGSALGAQSLSHRTTKGVCRVAVTVSSPLPSPWASLCIPRRQRLPLCLSSFLPEFSPEWSVTGLVKSYCHRMKCPMNVIISRIRSSLNYKHVHKVTKTSWLICMSPAQTKLYVILVQTELLSALLVSIIPHTYLLWVQFTLDSIPGCLT